MIAVINVEITAANPSMPLFPWRAYLNSPSSLRIRNVPRRVGNWNIDKVYVTAAYPDNSIKSADCILVGGIWVCTVAGSASTGFSQNGYTIYADGKDENGNEVTGYVLGKGDITILESDGTITPDETSYYVHMLSAEPTSPKEGDLWQTEGSWFIYQDGTSYPIGDDSGLIRQLSNELSNYANVSALNNYFPLSGGTLSSSEGEIDIGPWGAIFHNDTILSSMNENTINIRLNAKIAFDYLIDDNTDQTLQTQLSLKQDKLSDPQISAINSVVDERATIFDFGNGDISALNLFGEITVQELIDAGIHAEDDTWIKDPVSVKLGTAVTGIDEYMFFTAFYMTNITLPNSVTHIDACAFQECHALSSITIPESVESVGAYAFDACYNLTSIIVKGKTQAEAEALLAGARVPEGCEITTWNDASQEWVKEQGYLTSIPNTYKTYNDTLSSLSSDGYATTTYAVHNLSGVANITSMPLSSYEAISATADVETLYVITED